MSTEELALVWNNIKAEARSLADSEPMLASFSCHIAETREPGQRAELYAGQQAGERDHASHRHS